MLKSLCVVLVIALIAPSYCQKDEDLLKSYLERQIEKQTYNPDNDAVPFTPERRWPRRDRGDDWWSAVFATIDDFVREGNWGEGGPKDMITFLTGQISRMIQRMLKIFNYDNKEPRPGLTYFKR